MPSDKTDVSVVTTEEEPHALSPELEDLAGEALRYHEAALSESTRKAYENAWTDFRQFCETHGLPLLPSTEQAVALYLTDRAGQLAVSTLDQRLAAIQHVHDREDVESPTRSKAVRNVMKGIRREEDSTPNQAPPLLTDQIKEMVDSLPGAGPRPSGTEAEATWLRAKRDQALLLVGYAGAFRRSEIAGIDVGDVERRPDGALITVRRSKTDQEGEGQLVALRRIENSAYCPVSALQDWQSAAEIEEGPLFRGVPRSGIVRASAITGRTVGNVVKQAADRAGLSTPESYSGHSLRAGHITQASMEGAPEAAIQAQSRHESPQAFQEYIRPQKLLEQTSSAHLGL